MQPIYENIKLPANSSLKVALYNHSKTCATTNWHIHPEYELVYVRNGSGILKISSKTDTYTNGVLLFLGPNIQHADFGNKEFANNLEVVIQFTHQFVTEKLTVFPEFRKLKKLLKTAEKGIVFAAMVHDELAPTFEKFNTMNEAQKLINFMNILEKLSTTNNFKTIITDKKLTSHKPTDVTRLEFIFQFINEHYAEAINIAQLASQLGLTKNSFCRFFKKMTHQTFVQFVNEFRIHKAVEILNTNQKSIAEVMYSCGFNDASYFSKQFKKYHKTTPTNYVHQLNQPLQEQ